MRSGELSIDPPGATDGLRVLVINWQDRLNPRAGGAEVHLHEIFRRLRTRGHRVTFLVSGWKGAPPHERVDGIPVFRVGQRYTFPLHVRRGYRRLASDGFDLVVEDINKVPLFSPLWVGRPVLALVPHLFGTTAFREVAWPVAATVWLSERAMPWVYRSVPFQAISQGTKQDLARRGFAPDRVEVIYPGIEHERFQPDARVARFERPTALYLGRLKRYKGLEVVLDALCLLRERGVDVRLLIAGRGDDRERLERETARRDLGSQVEFLGFVDESRKVELFRRAWVNVYPSPKEGWGITSVEAAACGTPTVASDSPGLRESVAEGASGFLVRHGDAAEWAARLHRIVREPDLRKRLTAGAIRHAGRFSWDKAAIETERSFIELCGSRGGAG